MSAHILSLSSVTPDTICLQQDVATQFSSALKLEVKEAKKLHLIFQNSKIDKRHSVIPDFKNDMLKGSFFGENFPEEIPCTLKRNRIYKDEAPKLAHKACEEALCKWGQSKDTITHVISVSCTGMYAPGIEFGLIESLNLNPTVERLGINFMGCFGAFKGLAIAKSLAKENPNHRVLLVCTELCSLHFQSDPTIETFVANGIFADGAAAAIIGCQPTPDEHSLFTVEKNSSYALKTEKELMSWEIANSGMRMKLSPEVPKAIALHIEDFAKQVLGESIPFSSCEWAIHPGGRAIVEAIETTCGLSKNQTESSWKTLQNFGNMSSATFLFVLHEIARKKSLHEYILGLGFGPGLSIEGILLRPK